MLFILPEMFRYSMFSVAGPPWSGSRRRLVPQPLENTVCCAPQLAVSPCMESPYALKWRNDALFCLTVQCFSCQYRTVAYLSGPEARYVPVSLVCSAGYWHKDYRLQCHV